MIIFKKIQALTITITNILISAFSSQWFFIVVIVLFIVQALWWATTVRYPMLFDESYHVGVIQEHINQMLPIIGNQPTRLDEYGSVVYGHTSLYHLTMSLPYRLVAMVSDNFILQIIFLRLINIAYATIGLIIFAKTFSLIGIKRIYGNITLLIFTLVPIVPFVSATISYDNLIFLLTAAFMFQTVKIIQARKLILGWLYGFIITGMLASLVKYTFLPVFIFGVIYIALFLRKKYQSTIFSLAKKNIDKSSKLLFAVCIAVFLTLSSLFTLRYIVPIIKYSSPLPKCHAVLSIERCMNNGVYKYEYEAMQTKQERQPEPVGLFALTWLKTVVMQLDTSAANTRKGIEIGKAMPVYSTVLILSVYVGAALIIYRWKEFTAKKSWQFLLFTSVFIVGYVALFNMVSYYSVNLDINTQARYFLSILPIFIVMSVMSLSKMLGRHRVVKVGVLTIFILLATQGGGIIKPIMNANSGWFWENNYIINMNQNIKDLLAPVVNE
jgi:hypothetical protein